MCVEIRKKQSNCIQKQNVIYNLFLSSPSIVVVVVVVVISNINWCDCVAMR